MGAGQGVPSKLVWMEVDPEFGISNNTGTLSNTLPGPWLEPMVLSLACMLRDLGSIGRP